MTYLYMLTRRNSCVVVNNLNDKMETENSLANLNSAEINRRIQCGEFVLCQKVARSRVWEVFTKIINRDGIELMDYVYCKGCEKVFRTPKQATSNLVKHKCYTLKFLNNDSSTSEIEVEKPTIAVTVVENSVTNLCKLLTKWIINDCRPYGLIENKGLKLVFQEFVSLGSKFGCDMDIDRLLPKTQLIVQNVMNIYEQCFLAVKAEIAAIKENGFSLTANIWTDNFSKQSYLALTIHYLKAGVLKYRLLGLRAVDGEKHSSENISATVQQILHDFDCELSSSIIIVTDGSSETTEAFHNCQNLPCITQLLNNAIQNSLEEVPEVAQLISSCIKLVNCIKKKPLDNSFSELLPTYCPSRWNTMYKMLSFIENNWAEIETTLRNENEAAQILSVNKTHLKAFTKILQPFEDAIETLEEDNNPTLHLVIAYLHELKKSCDINEFKNEDFDFIESFKEHLRFNLEKIADENITNLHKLALFLFPPTNKLLQFNNKEKECIESECIRLMKLLNTEIKPIVKQEPKSPNQPASKRVKLLSDFVESKTSQDLDELIAQEIQYYKNTRVVNNADFDVFSWWEIQKDNFPLLYKLGCTVVSTPASCAASRKIFSSAGNLLWENSNQASKETNVEQIMFINTNAESDELDSHFIV